MCRTSTRRSHLPDVTVSLRVCSAGRPLANTTPPQPAQPLTVFSGLAKLDEHQLWAGSLGLFMFSVAVLAAVFGGDSVPPMKAPQEGIAHPWLLSALLRCARFQLLDTSAPPPPPPAQDVPAEQGPLLLCGALLLLIASSAPASTRRLATGLVAFWATMQAIASVLALRSESDENALRRFRFLGFIAIGSVTTLFRTHLKAPETSRGMGELTADEAFKVEFRGSEFKYG